MLSFAGLHQALEPLHCSDISTKQLSATVAVKAPSNYPPLHAACDDTGMVYSMYTSSNFMRRVVALSPASSPVSAEEHKSLRVQISSKGIYASDQQPQPDTKLAVIDQQRV